MKLSKRLMAIARMVQKHSNHGELADIGSDHGYLPVWLVLNDVISSAIACEIADGPIQALKKTIQLSHTEDKISVKKGDGLQPIIGSQLDMITICGMGGNLICQILDRDLSKLAVSTLVLAPNVNEGMVREWLMQHGWQIVDETAVEDMHHYYEIIVAKPGCMALNAKEIYMGPVLLKEKPDIIFKKWKWQIGILEDILKTLNESNEKHKTIHSQHQWLKEEL